jgi:hypothetical protein
MRTKTKYKKICEIVVKKVLSLRNKPKHVSLLAVKLLCFSGFPSYTVVDCSSTVCKGHYVIFYQKEYYLWDTGPVYMFIFMEHLVHNICILSERGTPCIFIQLEGHNLWYTLYCMISAKRYTQ